MHKKPQKMLRFFNIMLTVSLVLLIPIDGKAVEKAYEDQQKKWETINIKAVFLLAKKTGTGDLTVAAQKNVDEKQHNQQGDAGNQHLPDDAYQEYLDYFEEIYQTVNENYYKPIRRIQFDRFLVKFRTKIYSQLQETGKSDDYVRWRSASMLVEALRDPEDTFSALYPPEPAKEFEQTALGKRVDLGIEGQKGGEGYVVTHVEPRSDAYKKGLRIDDVITAIGEQDVLALTKDVIQDLLQPLEGVITKIAYVSATDRQEKNIEVETTEYFKQTVFLVPMAAPGVYCLKVERFNRKTGEDLFRFINYINDQENVVGLILDFRNNPGGPPLAAREMSSLFLPGGEDFAYFQRRGQPKSILDIPVIPNEVKFSEPMVILINHKSGSASELFSGVMQRRGRAVLMGENSAGAVLLKSMFHLSDDSMVLLVTARGRHPDGVPFSFKGLIPDRRFEKDDDDELYKYGSLYLYYINKKI